MEVLFYLDLGRPVLSVFNDKNFDYFFQAIWWHSNVLKLKISDKIDSINYLEEI